ncbi:MAG: DUF2934 domain-containing protein [Nitrospiraceae bacterium]
MTSAQASWTAWQVPGVKSVKNGSHGEGKGLGFQSHDRRAIRPSISGHSQQGVRLIKAALPRAPTKLYEERGRQEGQAVEDWVNAERQLSSSKP